jgi:hypothetical protein
LPTITVAKVGLGPLIFLVSSLMRVGKCLAYEMNGRVRVAFVALVDAMLTEIAIAIECISGVANEESIKVEVVDGAGEKKVIIPVIKTVTDSCKTLSSKFKEKVIVT